MTIPVPDLRDPNAVLNYGADAQAKIADFSEMVLQNMERERTEDVNNKITTLILQLKGTAEEKNNKRFPFRNRHAFTGSRYRRACGAVEKIGRSLQDQKDRLMRDIEMLELLHRMNREQYQALTEYVEQGKNALEDFRKNRGFCEENSEIQAERFEKKLYELELTQTVSLQMAPQIRLLQNNNALLAEKIQSTLTNVIPLWKSQLVFALTLNATRQTLRTQEKVSDITNTLLQQNAKNLQETSLAVTRCSQQGHTATKTLAQTHEILLETLDKMLELQKEGQRVRREAETELQRLNRQIRLSFSANSKTRQLP